MCVCGKTSVESQEMMMIGQTDTGGQSCVIQALMSLSLLLTHTHTHTNTHTHTLTTAVEDLSNLCFHPHNALLSAQQLPWLVEPVAPRGCSTGRLIDFILPLLLVHSVPCIPMLISNRQSARQGVEWDPNCKSLVMGGWDLELEDWANSALWLGD